MTYYIRDVHLTHIWVCTERCCSVLSLLCPCSVGLADSEGFSLTVEPTDGRLLAAGRVSDRITHGADRTEAPDRAD